MIKHRVREFREGDFAVQETVITFFGIPIYRYRKTTTNSKAVNLLTITEKRPQIKGFI